jgi:dihydrofolate reductase
VVRPVIYSMSVSLDGFIAGPDGAIDWAAPNDELMAFHNAQTRQLGAHVCGRKLYEDMLPWETDPARRDMQFSKLWKQIPKVVFSRTLREVKGNARLATESLPEELAKLRDGPGEYVSVGGAGLASSLIDLDLIDEYRLFVTPVLLGGGTPFFPAGIERLDLELVETKTFGSGVVYLRYRRSANPSTEADGST